VTLLTPAPAQYASAHAFYKNLDKLIHYANRDGRLNVFYSTPAEYVAAKHGYHRRWPLKTDDFFPYADCPHCYWTGEQRWLPALVSLHRRGGCFFNRVRGVRSHAAAPSCDS